MKPLIIRDEIHGDMSFGPILAAAIDHPIFQRLRRIKQLGLAEFVFPCATHTRFQHSMGASYLAGQYFESMMGAWGQNPFLFESNSGSTHFFSERTRRCVGVVAEDKDSLEFWQNAVQLAALLHDIGHGPWSHTFEQLALRQDFATEIAAVPGAIGRYLKRAGENGRRLYHEDLSVLYAHKIFADLNAKRVVEGDLYFPVVSLLIHRKMGQGSFQKDLEKELTETLTAKGIAGGVDFHRLLRPIISGPFDVDRMDYIQRDGRNCGVFISGIEWRRIVSKLIPCLAEHASTGDEPRDVVLVSQIKNQHVLDDFIFTLFQMYAQVYMHPKIVGLEEIIRRLVESRIRAENSPVVNSELHQNFTDEKFRDFLSENNRIPEINRLLSRGEGTEFEVARYPVDGGVDEVLKAENYSLIAQLDRPMLKDSVGVFLYSAFQENDGARPRFFVRPWSVVSPIAHQFGSINYSPNFWLKCDWL